MCTQDSRLSEAYELITALTEIEAVINSRLRPLTYLSPENLEEPLIHRLTFSVEEAYGLCPDDEDVEFAPIQPGV